jgi:murein DD-endopeptidase MepM/ murein hydrolase activator NlpD
MNMVFEARWRWDALMAALFLGAAVFVKALWISPSVSNALDESLLIKPGETIPLPDPRVFKALDRFLVTDVRVKRGEHLWSLAKTYGTTWDSIRSTNKLDSTLLSPGQKITIHNHRGMVSHISSSLVGTAHNLQDLARVYHQDPTILAVVNELPGVALLSWDFQPDQGIFLPNALLRFPDYILPVGWGRISSGFGMRLHPILGFSRHHTGMDMPRPYGTPVKCAREGRVIFTGWEGGYGLLVTIRHSDGMTTRYGHLSKILVNPGDWIHQKQVIGNVGSTGLSTGPHLHFEVRDRNGRPLNPKRYLF